MNIVSLERRLRLLVFVGMSFCWSPCVWGADCNGNGVEDTEDIAAGVSEDCNANGIPDACEGFPLDFARGPQWPLEGWPEDVASGDLDGDGNRDVVVVGISGGHTVLTWFGNKGNRQGLELAGEQRFSGECHDMELADLNHDQRLDVIMAFGDHVKLMLGQEGGGLEALPSVLAAQETDFLHVADLNHDGLMDVLGVNRGNATLQFWPQAPAEEGEVTFGDVVSVDVGSLDPVALQTGDIDRDGDLDVIVATQQDGDYVLLLNEGNGTFAEPRVWEQTGSRLDPHSMNVADLNGDGWPDLAVTRTLSNRFLFNSGGNTFGDLREDRASSIFSALRGLELADFDRDGDLDWVSTSSREGLTVGRNDGDGGNALSRRLGFGEDILKIEAGDVDGDGWADIMVASSAPHRLELVWNEGGQQATAFGIEVEVLPLEGCSDARGCRPHGGTLADLDGDGDLEGIALMTHPGEFHFVDNRSGVMVTAPKPYSFGRDGAANGEHSQWVAAGDLDGDGDADLVTVDNHSHDFWVHLNRGDGSFEAVPKDRRIRIGEAPQHVVLGDLDGDGDLDGVTANLGEGSISVLLGHGDGSFASTSTTIATGGGTRGVAIGDLNGDGLNDLVAANSAARSLTVLINQGDGIFPRRGDGIRLVGNPNGVTLADFDEDGDLDIAAAVGDEENCALLTNLGKGLFTEVQFSSPTYFPVDEAGVYTLTAVDFNRDGDLDLVTANETAGSVSILLGRGDGSFGAPESHSAGQGAGNRMALPADLDGDGDIDIMTFNRGNHTATVLRNRSALDVPDYANEICTVGDFLKLAATRSDGATEFIKFALPVSEEAGLDQVVFQNSSRFRLHQDFLTQVFPEKFPALDALTYDNLVGWRASRQYFVGSIRVLRTPKGAQFAFDVFARFGDAQERLSPDEVAVVRQQLAEAFRLGPLVYGPTSLEAVELAQDWLGSEVGFPIVVEGTRGGFEPYTLGVGYGRVRLLSEADFEKSNETGGISFQDILVLERAPRDIEGVVNGILTEERQGELSHLAVRTSRRGTPNAFARDAMESLREFEGQLVRLEVTETGHTVRRVSEKEAEAFWEANGGFLSQLPARDAAFFALTTLDEIARLEEEDGEGSSEARFGGKASNLARLRSILTDEWSRYQPKGFAVPMAHYLEFMRSNRMPSALEPSTSVTYERYLEELFENERFATDSTFRFASLETLREHMEADGAVSDSLLASLRDLIPQVMGTGPEVRVRFRSSSNAEDAIEFNGAGLYESTQGCVADDLDGDDKGPSRCNSEKKGERGLARALKRVWSSLWTFRAVEERAFYGIPSELPAMAVLVSEAFVGEQANGVATTGNATLRTDPRFVITVQKEDQSVVSPDPGVLPEKNVLEMSEDGQVTNIIRAVSSTLTGPGEVVLSDPELEELGALMWHIHTEFPLDLGDYAREDLVLEMEFKKSVQGNLVVKQVRPLLLVDRERVPPEFMLDIPEASVLCGKFDAPNLSRTVFQEEAYKGQLHLHSGEVRLPTDLSPFSGALVEKLVYGQDQRVATPRGPGSFVFEKLPGDAPGELVYRFDYQQELAFPNGDRVEVEWALLDFDTMDGVVQQGRRRLVEPFSVDEIALRATVHGEGEPVTNYYGSCGMESLPLWKIHVALEDGARFVLEERFRAEAFGDFQPAALVGARVHLGEETRTVEAYWDLVYKASRHNEHVEHLVRLEPPVVDQETGESVHAVRLIAPTHDGDLVPTGVYLDAMMQEIRSVPIVSYERTAASSGDDRNFPAGFEVGVHPLEVDGERAPFVVLRWEAADAGQGVWRVESSLDLIQWTEDGVRLEPMEGMGDQALEQWRSGSSVRETGRRFYRVRLE